MVFFELNIVSNTYLHRYLSSNKSKFGMSVINHQNFVNPNAGRFVTVSHFHPTLIFAGKAEANQSGAP
jgi:hypothetical protein